MEPTDAIERLLDEPLLPWQRAFLSKALTKDAETGEYVYHDMQITGARVGVARFFERLATAQAR